MADLDPRGESRPAVDAATILLLRDGSDGVEVFMQQRHLDSDFVGGAYVFPGGKVDPTDRALAGHLWDGLPRDAHELVGGATDADALGLFAAAVRETFEEGGVLLARRDGEVPDAATLAERSFVDARERLAARGEPYDWSGWLQEQGLVLDLGALRFWSWWVTPDGPHKRYDTRFFAAAVPEGQAGALGHDDVEMTDSLWVTATRALHEAAEGRVRIVYPTRKNLEALARFDTVEDVLRACELGHVDQRRIKPIAIQRDGQVMVLHPDSTEPEPF